MQRAEAMVAGHDFHARRAVAGLVFLLIGIGFLLEGMGVWSFGLVWLWPVLLIGLGSSSMLGRAKRIKVEEDRSAQLAVAEERVRIARELHDIVAHSVSLMTVQIAAARRVGTKKPEAAAQALEAAEATGRQSLTELRSIVSVLRSADESLEAASMHDHGYDDMPEATRAPLPGLADIKTCVEGVRDAGLDVAYSVLGAEPQVSPAIGLAVYRVIQEALTNVIRHAPGAKAEVSVMYLPTGIDIRIEDDGGTVAETRPSRAAGAAPAGTGHGLIGMRERIGAVGGAVSSGRKAAGGWEVRVEIPLLPDPT